MPNGENKQLFGNLVRSDGFSIDFLFCKRQSNQKEIATKKSKNRISQYHMTSSTRYSSELNKLKKDNSTNIIESAIPTDKTSGPEKYLQHVAYIRQNLSTLFKFYSAVTEKKPLFLVPRKAKGTRVDGEHAA
ncbi:hypothetical protein J3Q64DRAFT_1702154 [Phycomyces blakesleeanus]|uniref:Uncharacterized protein n=1 Tax=Phycomyces blakesleeanus TaxID=4837 RepID=A0ABR3AQD8_PHYBL